MHLTAFSDASGSKMVYVCFSDRVDAYFAQQYDECAVVGPIMSAECIQPNNAKGVHCLTVLTKSEFLSCWIGPSTASLALVPSQHRAVNWTAACWVPTFNLCLLSNDEGFVLTEKIVPTKEVSLSKQKINVTSEIGPQNKLFHANGVSTVTMLCLVDPNIADVIIISTSKLHTVEQHNW